MRNPTPRILSTILRAALLVGLCFSTPIRRRENSKIENTCYGKNCVVTANFDSPDAISTYHAQNVTDAIGLSLQPILETQELIARLLQNQTEKQENFQEKIAGSFERFQEDHSHGLQMQEEKLIELKDVLEYLPNLNGHVLPMGVNKSSKVIVVESNHTSSTLSSIAESQVQIMILLQNQTASLTSLLDTIIKLANQPQLPTSSLSAPLPPRDCKDILLQRYSISKSYPIQPWRDGKTYNVYCDMETDDGGWTLFQRRFNGSVSFARGWDEYVNGFGDTEGEHWAGLELVYQLTRSGDWYLSIDVEYSNGEKRFSVYSDFMDSDKESSFKLYYDGYSRKDRGGQSRAQVLDFHVKNKEFSTVDHRQSSNSWPRDHRYGGWWCCGRGGSHNLNGLHFEPGFTNVTDMQWWSAGSLGDLIKSSMKIRR